MANKSGSGNGNITSAMTNDSSIVTVTNTATSVTIRALRTGNTTVTVNWTDSNTSQMHTDQIYVTVTDSYNSNTGSTLNVSVGSTVNTNSLGQIVSATTLNSGIATAYNNNTYASVTGVSAGTTTLTVLYYNSGSANISTATYTVNVTGSYTGTGSTSAVSQPFSLEVGKTANIPSVVAATNVVSSNPSVGTAAIENGQMVLRGLSAGTTEITFNGSTTAGGASTAYKITLTVTGTGTASSGGTSSSGGVSFSKTSTSVSSGKNYRLKGMKVNGSSAVAGDLRWMSTNTDVLTVNAKTGVFKGKTSGTAYLVAADPDSGAVGSIKVEIN